MDKQIIYMVIPMIIVPYLMIYNYLYLFKKVYLSRLEKLYLFDGWVFVVIGSLYLHYVKNPQILLIIGYIIVITLVMLIQKMYLKQMKYAKYELYFRKSRDLRDFDLFQSEFEKELFMEESTKSQILSIVFKTPNSQRNIAILKLLTMNKELFKQYDEKNRLIFAVLRFVLMLCMIGLYAYFLVTMPI